MLKELKTLNGVRTYFLYFFLYAVFGWCYEVFLEVVVYRWGFSDRGVLFGPYCPVYGFGALLFLLLAYPLIKGKTSMGKKLLWAPVIFLICMVSATLLELLTSYLCEWVTGSWPWQTYARDYPNSNFEGRIALSPSLRFGLGGLLFLYLLQPGFEWIAGKLRGRALTVLSTGLMVLLALDVAATFLL